jgi:uncharacterized protein YdeI (YjbR/CyaY-like superfamily)
VTATFFASAAAFRAWLEKHHDRETALLVGLYKNGARPRPSRDGGLSYQDALDEALAFGWIDGVRRRIDAERWSIRFTPRASRSIWSLVNIRHVKRLTAEGRMAAPGLKAFEVREPMRTGVYSYETGRRPPAAFDRASAKALAANPRAKAFFDAQPPGYRKLAAGWVRQAKKEETRARRLARVIEMSAQQKRIDFLKPYA